MTDHDAQGASIEQATRAAEELIQRGVEAKRAGDYQEAQRLYEAAATCAPWDFQVYYSLGKLHYLAGAQEESLLNYTVTAHLHLGLGPSQQLDPGHQQARQSTVIASFCLASGGPPMELPRFFGQ